MDRESRPTGDRSIQLFSECTRLFRVSEVRLRAREFGPGELP